MSSIKAEKKVIYLAEYWNEDIQVPEGVEVVALNQEAFYQMEHCGQACTIMEDHYSSGEIRSDCEEYRAEQLKWFSKFDDYLREIYPIAKENNMALGSMFYYYLKHFIDNVVMTARTLKYFIKVKNPDQIVFFGKKILDDSFEYTLSFQNFESTYSRLIKEVCVFCGVDCIKKDLVIETDVIEGTINQIIANRKGKKIASKTKLYKYLVLIRNIFMNWKMYRRYIRNNNSNTKKILLLTQSEYLYQLLVEFQKDLYDVKIEFNNHIISSSLDFIKTFFPMKDKRKFRQKSYQLDSDSSVEFRYLMKDLTNGIGCDLFPALKKRMCHFIENICPELIENYLYYRDLYKRKKINYVAIHVLSSPAHHAAMAAAKSTKGVTTSIGFAHGADASVNPFRMYCSALSYDIFFTVTKGERDFCIDQAKEFNVSGLEYYTYPNFQSYYQNQIKMAQSSPSAPRGNLKDKETVLFVPFMCAPWPNRPLELTYPLPMEFLRWHKALIDYFSTRTDYHFIWKGFYLAGQDFDYIARYIESNNIKNVEFHSNKLTSWFSKVDRALFDISSTAFFEAISVDLPVLALHRPTMQDTRLNAIKDYGCSLGSFDTIEEGLTLVKDYLDSDKVKYTIKNDEEKKSVIDYLKLYESRSFN